MESFAASSLSHKQDQVDLGLPSALSTPGISAAVPAQPAEHSADQLEGDPAMAAVNAMSVPQAWPSSFRPDRSASGSPAQDDLDHSQFCVDALDAVSPAEPSDPMQHTTDSLPPSCAAEPGQLVQIRNGDDTVGLGLAGHEDHRLPPQSLDKSATGDAEPSAGRQPEVSQAPDADLMLDELQAPDMGGEEPNEDDMQEDHADNLAEPLTDESEPHEPGSQEVEAEVDIST